MSPEAQRIAIAEACGWKNIHLYYSELYGENRLAGYAPYDPDDATQIRDYLDDLNAMHEAEKVLNDSQLADMAERLGADCEKTAPADVWCLLLRATAAQRSEAFLRTVGKWEDGK